MPKKPTKEEAKQPPRRKRGKIYSDRVTFSLRLMPALHTALMNYCDEYELTANTFICDLINSELIRKSKR
jgi:predicted HicB family RNase H-like nuclease